MSTCLAQNKPYYKYKPTGKTGAQFTGFTGTKVQIRSLEFDWPFFCTLKSGSSRRRRFKAPIIKLNHRQTYTLASMHHIHAQNNVRSYTLHLMQAIIDDLMKYIYSIRKNIIIGRQIYFAFSLWSNAKKKKCIAYGSWALWSLLFISPRLLRYNTFLTLFIPALFPFPLSFAHHPPHTLVQADNLYWNVGVNAKRQRVGGCGGCVCISFGRESQLWTWVWVDWPLVQIFVRVFKWKIWRPNLWNVPCEQQFDPIWSNWTRSFIGAI